MKGGGNIPSKAIINNCVSFIADVKRIATKTDLNQQEAEIKRKAAVIAALSSNHSWKTSKYLQGLSDVDRESFSEEANRAVKSGWRNINESDVDEVVNGNIKPHLFSMWMFYALDEKQRNEFGQMFNKLRQEQEYNMESAGQLPGKR